jgi:ELWxxDGT repeat protein
MPATVLLLLVMLFTAAAGCGPTAESPAPGTERSRFVAPPPVGAPYLVADLWPGSANSEPSNVTRVDGGAYFIATSPDRRGDYSRHLWRTDGTSAGTRPLSWLNTTSSEVATLGSGLVFYGTHTLQNRSGLWITDGTEEGTVLLRAAAGGFAPRFLGASGGRVFFSSEAEAVGLELWVTDGTAEGTRVLGDLNPGVEGSRPAGLRDVAGTAFFGAKDETHGFELWKSDGTPEGTRRVTDLDPGPTSSDTLPLAALGNVLLFTASTPALGRELWRTDGTPGGTSLVADLNPGGASSVVSPLGVLGGALYLAMADGIGTGFQVWRTDGTEAGTTRVAVLDSTLEPFIPPLEVVVANGRIFFTRKENARASPRLWTTDGTSEGTYLLENPALGPVPTHVTELAAAGDRVYFSAWTPNESTNLLWRTNGHRADTVPIEPIPSYLFPHALTVTNGRLLFVANSKEHGKEPWGMCLSTCPREPPLITCPIVKFVEAQSAAGGVVGLPLATAMIDGVRTEQIQYSVPPGSFLPLGATNVTATVTDPEGGSASCTIHVIVSDTQGPKLTCPEWISLEAEGDSAVLIYPEVEVFDLVGPVTLEHDPPAGTRIPVGISSAWIRAQDGALQVSSCRIGVVVKDTDPTDPPPARCGCGSGAGGGTAPMGTLLGLWLLGRRSRHSREGR